jgi:hypothetical protein
VRTKDGRIWWSALITRVRFRIASARGLTCYDGDDGLPGVLADMTMVREQPYAVISDNQGHCSTLVLFDADRSEWLNSIEAEPDLVAVSITIQAGAALHSGFAIAESAGALTRSVLREALPPTASVPAAWACLTWRGDADAVTAQMDTFVSRTGLGQPLSGETVASLVSTAFDPSREPVTTWDHAGPGSAHEFRNRYEHAEMTSLVWRVTAGASALGRLLSDETTATLERVTAVYVGQPAGGLRQGLVVTLTCPDERSLALAASAMRSRAKAAGVTLAPSAATMASSFAVGLGVGVTGGPR